MRAIPTWQAAASSPQPGSTATGHTALFAVIGDRGRRHAGLAFARRSRLAPSLQRAQPGRENVVNVLLIACSSIAILTTIGIVLSLVFESIRFFGEVPFFDFLFGTGMEPADRAPRRPGRLDGRVRRDPAVRRYDC